VTPVIPAKSVVGPSSSAPASTTSARPRIEHAHMPFQLTLGQEVRGHVPEQLASARLFTRRRDVMTAAPCAIVTQTPGTAALALTTTTRTPGIADFAGELPADALAVESEAVVAEANRKGGTQYRRSKELAERLLRRSQMKETVAESLFQAREETSADVECIAVPRSRGKAASASGDPVLPVASTRRSFRSASEGANSDRATPRSPEPVERSGALHRLQRSDGNPCSSVPVVPDCPCFDWYTRCALEVRQVSDALLIHIPGAGAADAFPSNRESLRDDKRMRLHGRSCSFPQLR
jgi:hypothetical protein